jgi:hypothetical protein
MNIGTITDPLKLNLRQFQNLRHELDNNMPLLMTFIQTWLRGPIGVNLADVRRLDDELLKKSITFAKGVLPETEAADFAIKTTIDVTEYHARADKELKRLQEIREEEGLIRISPSGVEGFNDIYLALTQYEDYRKSVISAIESLITELERVRRTAADLAVHVQEYANTPEYRERHMAFVQQEQSAETQEKKKEPPPIIKELIRLV